MQPVALTKTLPSLSRARVFPVFSPSGVVSGGRASGPCCRWPSRAPGGRTSSSRTCSRAAGTRERTPVRAQRSENTGQSTPVREHRSENTGQRTPVRAHRSERWGGGERHWTVGTDRGRRLFCVGRDCAHRQTLQLRAKHTGTGGTGGDRTIICMLCNTC